MEISVLEDRFYKIINIDPYVDYDIGIAINSYKSEMFPVSLLFCGIALEEQLSAIYEIATNKDRKIEDMDLGKLIEWAKNQNIITDRNIFDSIRLARNYFGHSMRIIQKKYIAKLENQEFDGILPEKITYPDWFDEFVKMDENITGNKIEPNKPVIGWLYHEETSLNAIEVVIEFIENTNHLIN